MEDFVCWKCGGTLAEVSLPLSRYARCPACDAELYVCRMCRHEHPGRSGGCREERAEPVRAPDVANFCDWLTLRPNAYRRDGDGAEREAHRQLEALFGGTASKEPETGGAGGQDDPAREALDRLFGKKGG